MKDGSYYTGAFYQGEIEGEGEFHYQNGAFYKGSFHLGEKHGNGLYTSPELTYEGEWHMNTWRGTGIMKTPTVQINGTFYNNKAHGSCKFTSDEYSYEGDYDMGKKHGQGNYSSINQKYVGGFANDLRDGEGILDIGQFHYEGIFSKGEPTVIANMFRYKIDQIEEPQDPKKKDIAIKDYTKNIYWQVGRVFGIELQACYQGPDQEDPVQPTQQEIDELIKNWQKEAKKQKNPPPMPDFSAKRMIKPPPELVYQESGRVVEVNLIQKSEQGQIQFRVDYRQMLKDRREEVEKIKAEMEAQKLIEEQAQAVPKKKDAKKQAKKPENEVIDLSIKLFQEGDAQPLQVILDKAVAVIKDLEYPEDFPPGTYYYIIKDVSVDSIGALAPIEIELQIQGDANKQPLKKK